MASEEGLVKPIIVFLLAGAIFHSYLSIFDRLKPYWFNFKNY
jgi:hypothetical protein